MNGVDIIRQWIEARSANGGNAPYYRHILENGKAFNNIVRKSPKVRHFKAENKTVGKGCYANSQRFAQAYPGVRYFEGFRFGGIVVQGYPIVAEFAWNVEGYLVVERTKKLKEEAAPVYFGVEVPVGFLKSHLGKDVCLPRSSTTPAEPGMSIPVSLTLGTPLLFWYLRLREDGAA